MSVQPRAMLGMLMALCLFSPALHAQPTPATRPLEPLEMRLSALQTEIGDEASRPAAILSQAARAIEETRRLGPNSPGGTRAQTIASLSLELAERTLARNRAQDAIHTLVQERERVGRRTEIASLTVQALRDHLAQVETSNTTDQGEAETP